MTDFYKTETYLVVQKMKATGNQPGVVALWKNMMAHWAQKANGPDAEAARAWLPLWAERKFYTAAELAPIMPVLATALGITARPSPVKNANRLANELVFARLPFHQIDGVKYFAVEQTHRIADMLSEIEEFHNAQHG